MPSAPPDAPTPVPSPPAAELPRDTDWFRCRALALPTTPVVLSVPHAGIQVASFGAPLAPSLDVRCDADLHVDRLYGVAADSPAAAAPSGPFISATLSRFVCDLNRHPDDVSATSVPEHPHPSNADGRGFIWAMTTTGARTLTRPLSVDEWRARAAVHAAYHGALRSMLARARERFGFAVLVDGHSMPSVGRAGHRDPGHARADVVPGDRDGTSCAPSLSRLVKLHFAARGYSVAMNEPYKGGFITTDHGRPRDDVHAIQIELRRDLYMNEATFALAPAGFARLQQTLRELLAVLAGFRP